ncbi:MAG TPA: lipopolysaccharide biosynthesis protein [Thermoleophilaceae bacterium]|nr:lipopolysaccharide biosynthesis protein [Thermoleophilaceae bacterium]
MSPAGVAPSEKGAPGPGEARLLASGALVQGIAQASGLVALLVIVTVLARRLSVAQLGAYGLVASLAGYLLVLRNSVASSAVRAMASALDRDERARVFSAAAALYVAVGLITGLLIVGAALAIAGLILDGDLAREARAGGAGLGLVTALGIAASVNLDALRAGRLFVRGALTEIVAVALYLALMLALILGGADLALVIAASGAIPLLSGLLSALVARRSGVPVSFHAAGVTRERSMRIVPTAGWLLVVELSNLAMYAFSRVILGAYRSPAAVGQFEGPVRAHNLLYALAGALAVPVVPSASRYVAAGDERRLRELALRGTRYTLALFVPLCVTLMALAEPILDVWLGDRYGDGATALAILVSYWLLLGGLVVTPGFLVGVGRARWAGLIFAAAAALNLALTLALTPELGLEGPALGTAIPFVLAFPLLLRVGLAASGAPLGELARVAWLPAYALGAVLAGLLVAARAGLSPESLPAVLALAGGGLLAYWGAFYALVLSGEERGLVRGLVRRSG